MVARWSRFAVLLLALVLVAGAHFVRSGIGKYPQPHELLTPPDPVVTEVLALGDRTLAADLIWIEAVQYFGGAEGGKYRHALLAAMLDSVVDFDPDFRYAYVFGGLALTSTLAGVDSADALLERGSKRFPDDWRFPYYIGINALIYLEDNVRAAEYFGRAAQLPDSPQHLGLLATRLLAQAGECAGSLQLLEALLRNSKDQLEIQRLTDRRNHVIWECGFQTLESAAKTFAEHKGRPPRSIDELVKDGLLQLGLPPDPFGGTWRIDKDGKVESSTPRRRLWRRQTPGLFEQIKNMR
jgi:hypothetical protein